MRTRLTPMLKADIQEKLAESGLVQEPWAAAYRAHVSILLGELDYMTGRVQSSYLFQVEHAKRNDETGQRMKEIKKVLRRVEALLRSV